MCPPLGVQWYVGLWQHLKTLWKVLWMVGLNCGKSPRTRWHWWTPALTLTYGSPWLVTWRLACDYEPLEEIYFCSSPDFIVKVDFFVLLCEWWGLSLFKILYYGCDSPDLGSLFKLFRFFSVKSIVSLRILNIFLLKFSYLLLCLCFSFFILSSCYSE